MLCKNPAIGQPHARRAGVRRLLLSRIRYFLYDRATADGYLDVLAFWHASRGSEPRIDPGSPP